MRVGGQGHGEEEARRRKSAVTRELMKLFLLSFTVSEIIGKTGHMKTRCPVRKEAKRQASFSRTCPLQEFWDCAEYQMRFPKFLCYDSSVSPKGSYTGNVVPSVVMLKEGRT